MSSSGFPVKWKEGHPQAPLSGSGAALLVAIVLGVHCGLKGLQYMALGLPTVMSPVGVNTEIIQHGSNGFLARTEDEWVDQLTRLIEDADLRARIGTQARRTVEERYSVKVWRDHYLQLFNSLLKEQPAERAHNH